MTSGHYEKYGADSFQPYKNTRRRGRVFIETHELPAPL